MSQSRASGECGLATVLLASIEAIVFGSSGQSLVNPGKAMRLQPTRRVRRVHGDFAET